MSESQSNGRRLRRRARSDCKSGRHRYGSAQLIGGGIERRICSVCDAVSIDLTAAEEPVPAGLFKDRSNPFDHASE